MLLSTSIVPLPVLKVIPLLVGAIQEQEEKIQILNDRVEYLLRKVDSMS